MHSARVWHPLMVAVLSAGAIAATLAQRFSDWSAPVNLGSIVNSAFNDQQPAVSPDGLSLYFVSNRPGGTGGGLDLWVAQRDSLEDPWQAPVPLPSPLNTAASETPPSFAGAGHLLFFSSNRPGGCGSTDVWVSFRSNKRDDFGWQPPAHLGCGVNAAGGDEGAAFVEDDDEAGATLYFHSFRAGGAGAGDIWASTMNEDGTFNPPVNVFELNSPANDLKPTIQRGGGEIIFNSARSGNFDLWIATRDEHSLVWSVPENLGPTVNSAAGDNAPALSRDGRSLFFDSDRPGGSGFRDLYVSTRAKTNQGLGP
jgi:Tol biopolymer transport system component